ncbi:hypothetical protein [Aporhodopirellula aestuarii]|uniref:Uncharacterized protein n=1 Tax=Aporhodopirellula aestuarii TaxID=2950107 RepID=A0ABT0TYG9_9BACT|nr:hypothetical protein [Aporhodopirellula aestuarii]MCM2369634.1 hypothetical protein [Aporhodopirellula aestuarii]
MDDNEGCLAWITALSGSVCAIMTAVAAIASCVAAGLSYQSISDERERYSEQRRIETTPFVRVANEYTGIPIVSTGEEPFGTWAFSVKRGNGLRLHNFGKGNAHGCELHWKIFDRQTLRLIGSEVTFPTEKNSLAFGEEVIVSSLPATLLSESSTEGSLEIHCTNDAGEIIKQYLGFHTWMETSTDSSELRMHCFPKSACDFTTFSLYE